MQQFYSPDLAPDYHLFRSLQNFLNDVKLTSKEACENLVAVFCPEITEVLQWQDYGFISKRHRWSNKMAQIWF